MIWTLLEGEDTWFPNRVSSGRDCEAGGEAGKTETREWRDSGHRERATVRHPADEEGTGFPGFGNREVTGDLKDSMFQWSEGERPEPGSRAQWNGGNGSSQQRPPSEGLWLRMEGGQWAAGG